MKGEELIGGELLIEKEEYLDERLLSRESRAPTGGCESPPEQAAYRRSRGKQLRTRIPSIRGSED